MRTDKLESALAHAAAGWRVFPCHDIQHGRCSCKDRRFCKSPGKHPRLPPPGVHLATRDEAQVRAWWGRWPHANIGGACDSRVIVDVDVKPGQRGLETLAALEREHGHLETDLVQRTGSGGLHKIFAARKGVRYPGKLGAGIELLCGPGRYIMLAPSNHASGGVYAWERGDGADARFMLNLPAAPEWLERGVQPGRREADDLSTIAAMRPCGFTEKQIKMILGCLGFEKWCDDRDGWQRVGAILHHEFEGGADGLAMWDWFSEISDKFDPDDSERVWRSFGPRSAPLRMATLLREAQQSRSWSERRFRAAGDPLKPAPLASLIKPLKRKPLRKGGRS